LGIFKPEKEILEKYLDCTHFGLFYNKNNKFFDYYIINHFNIEFNMNINCIDCGWIFYETYKQHITYIDFKIILDTKTIIKSQTILEDYQIYLFLEKTIKNHNLISEYESYLKIEFEKISKTIPYNENCLKFFDEKINELEGLYTTKTSHLSKLYTERSRYYDIVSNLIVDEEKKKIEIHKKLVEYKKNRKKMKEDSFFMRNIIKINNANTDDKNKNNDKNKNDTNNDNNNEKKKKKRKKKRAKNNVNIQLSLIKLNMKKKLIWKLIK